MSPSWICSVCDKITNERVTRVGYYRFISNKGEWNNCFSKFSNRFLPPIFITTILQSGKFLNLAHYFPYDVKLRLLAHSGSFLANQKARNAIVGAENLLNIYSWRFARRYSAPIHWLVHGHMTSNNSPNVMSGISVRFSKFAFVLFCFAIYSSRETLQF